LASFRTELGEEVECDVAVHVDAVRGRARLSAVAELRDHRAYHRGVEVSVLGDHDGGVTAQFHRSVDNAVGCLAEQRAPNAGRAREGDLPDALVAEPRGDDRAGVGGRDDLEHPFRQPGLGEEPSYGEGCERGLRSGFEHDGAAGC